MVNWKTRKAGDVLWLLNALSVLVLINMISYLLFFRVDLTEEQRYSIKEPTQRLLSSLEDVVYVEVYLEGDLNASFKRLRNAIGETLDVFDSYSSKGIQYRFVDPTSAQSAKAQNEFVQGLVAKGVQMLPVIETRDGERVEKIVFPGAVISYQGYETGVMLFRHNQAKDYQEVINQSVEGLEYQLANAIATLTNAPRKRVAFLAGHGELDELSTASLRSALGSKYEILSTDLNSDRMKSAFDVLIVAKPRQRFIEPEKLRLDQYIMNGGSVLFCLDAMEASMDSASREDYFAFPVETGLQDQLFRYGARVNPDLVQDRVASRYPVITSVVDNQPQMMQMEWPFFPLINQYAAHSATRNMDATAMRFVSSVDTVRAVGISKTILMWTSPYSRKVAAPVKVSVNDLRRNVDPASFQAGRVPVGLLLEGSFTSLYKNRFLPRNVDTTGFIAQGVPSKIIVIGDGDFLRNDINPRNGKPQELGLDPFSGYVFANQDLALNLVDYLADENGLIAARNREVRLRPLDKAVVKDGRVKWQVINLVVPLAVLVVIGVLRNYFRRKRYAQFS